MKLLIVRHAPAEPSGAKTDAERRLTREGRDSFERSARGLATIFDPPAAILTSPLVRAAETAALLSQAWGGPEPQVEPALAGGTPQQVFVRVAALALTRDEEALVVLVGHEPLVSQMLAALLGLRTSESVAFKKGGAALLEFGEDFPQGGHLVAVLPPRLSRALA